MSEEEIYFHTVAELQNITLKSQMFGKPCYKINGKAFCCFFQNEMVFKLSSGAHGDALSLDGAQLFDPSGKGRAMKEWVQVPFEYKDMWKEFCISASEYVGSLSK